jgi:hypothetical protein
MKSKYLLLLLALFALLITGCKKDSTTTKLTLTQIAQVQNSDVQDAIADKNDQDVDNLMDQLQVANYTLIGSGLKSESLSGTRTLTVDKQDSVTFPKTITIVYANFTDNTADETFVKNGEIDITVTVTGNDKQLVTRTQTFKNFSIKTDSTTIKVNGSRTVVRSAKNFKYTGFTSLRFTITDNITANLSFAITKTGVSDTLKFTRVVSKTRKAYLHYTNAGGNTWQTIKFINAPAQDTVTSSGSVSGVNEKGENYTKTVDGATPLTLIFYQGVSPVLASGTMVLTAGTASFTISFKQDPVFPRLTLVTVTNNNTQATHTFDRKLARKLIKWW